MAAASDVEQIKALKYRYVRHLDLKHWDDFARCFVPEATADYAGLVFDDAAALVAYMRENMGERMISMHHLHHPEIEVTGDRATGTWYLEDTVLIPELDFGLEGAAFYSDGYVRTPEGWRIERTSYRRTYEASRKLSDVPSYRLKRGTAYDA